MRSLLVVAALWGAAPALAQQPKVTTDKSYYAPGEAITVTWSGFSFPTNSSKDWITIVPVSAPADTQLEWIYLWAPADKNAMPGVKEEGEWEVRAFKNWPDGKFNVVARARFRVGAGPPPAEQPVTPDAPASDVIRLNWNSYMAYFPDQSPGKRFQVNCPANTLPRLPGIYGNGTYSYNSPVCPAAVHAGVITLAGGTLWVNVVAAPATFTGATRNGITSKVQPGGRSNAFTVSKQ